MKDITYCLRTCDENIKSYNGFQWKKEGIIEAPDFKPTKACGNGLHGFLMGEGDGTLANWDEKAKWLVVEVNKADIIDLEGKVKFPKCKVVFCGSRKDATDFIICKGAKNVIGSFVTSGDKGTSNSGYKGVSTSGYKGVSTSGDKGVSNSGDKGVSNSGDNGTSTSGYFGTSISGDNGTSTSRDYGTSTSGKYGTSTSGNNGTSISGYYGTSTSGEKGTSTSGAYGTSTSGKNGVSTSGVYGTIVIKYYCSKTYRYKLATGYIGENGLKPNTPYKVDNKGIFYEVLN